MVENRESLQNALDIESRHHHRTLFHALGTLVRLANVERGKVHDRRFLSDGSAVTEHRLRLHLKVNIVTEPERFEQLYAWMEQCTRRFDALASARMRRNDHRHVIGRGDGVEQRHHAVEIGVGVDVFLAMSTHDEEAFRLEAHACERVRRFDLVAVVLKNLAHRTTGLDDHVRRKTLTQQIFARDLAVSQVDVCDMIDDAAIDFLGHALVEATISCLHVEGRNLASLRRDEREAAVGVAQDEYCIGAQLGEQLVGCDDDLANRLGSV